MRIVQTEEQDQQENWIQTNLPVAVQADPVADLGITNQVVLEELEALMDQMVDLVTEAHRVKGKGPLHALLKNQQEHFMLVAEAAEQEVKLLERLALLTQAVAVVVTFGHVLEVPAVLVSLLSAGTTHKRRNLNGNAQKGDHPVPVR